MARTVSRSVERAFAVLALFKQRQQPLTASQVRKSLNAPHASVHSILRELTDLGYLSFDDTEKAYLPTIQLVSLSNWIQRYLMGSSEVARATDALCAELNETVSVSSQFNIFTTVLYVKCADHRFALQLPVGNLGAPMCQTVVGRVMLSMMPDDDIEKIVGYTNRWGKVTKAGFNFKAAEILAKAAKIRKEGYLYESNNWTQGLGAIAAPVPRGGSAGQNLVLTVAGSTPRLQLVAKKIIPVIKAAARELTNRLTAPRQPKPQSAPSVPR